jgi:hypothetical protein
MTSLRIEIFAIKFEHRLRLDVFCERLKTSKPKEVSSFFCPTFPVEKTGIAKAAVRLNLHEAQKPQLTLIKWTIQLSSLLCCVFPVN